MKRNKHNKAWMHDHVNDPWVQKAQELGYRARAAFKLIEIDERDRLLRPGMTVVDLGAAPGSWSQVAARKLGAGGRVFALDLLPMAPIAGVEFMQGDFTDDAFAHAFEAAVGEKPVGLVMSDMAPNLTGVATTDQARSIHLCELAVDFAVHHLAPQGDFLVKVFQGEGFMEFRKLMDRTFVSVAVRKPKASRDRSAEVYLLGRKLKSR